MRLVVALGGSALLGRGRRPTAESIKHAARELAPLARRHELVVCHPSAPITEHGTGQPRDLVEAQMEGLVGYLVQQQLGNELPYDARIATVLTMIEVDPDDPSSLLPRRIVGLDAIEALLDGGFVVVCAGGGVPVTTTEEPAGRRLMGAEAAIDRDLATALLAIDLRADVLLSLTDIDAVYADWGTPQQRAIRRATPTALAAREFADGTMGPKVRAACTFVQQTGGMAAIGTAADIDALIRREAGTIVSLDGRGLEVVHAA